MKHSGRIAGLAVSLFLAAASGADFQNSLFFGGSGDDVTQGHNASAVVARRR